MHYLFDIIKLLSKEEARHFSLYQKRMNYGDNRKDMQLFKDYKSSTQSKLDNTLQKKLNKYGNANALYFLKHRLANDINKSLVLFHIEKSTINELYMQLSLCYIFWNKNAFLVAKEHLNKAEKIAIENNVFDMLDIIYSEFIKLSIDLIEINPDEYFEKRKQNLKILNLVREIDVIHALMNYRLKKHQNFAERDYKLLKQLEEKAVALQAIKNIENIKNLKTKIYKSITQILLQKRKYQDLEIYIKTTLSLFEKNQWFDKDNHELHLQMLIYLINTLCRNGKYLDSLHYASVLKPLLQTYQNKHYDKYIFYYYQALVINYNSLDINKSVDLLIGMNKSKLEGINKDYTKYFILLNLAITHFRLMKYSKAAQYLEELKKTPTYKKLDESLKMKTEIFSAINLYELDVNKILLPKLNELKKLYKNILSKKDFKSDKIALQILTQLKYSKNEITKKEAKLLFGKYYNELKSLSHIDTEIISYYKWAEIYI